MDSDMPRPTSLPRLGLLLPLLIAGCAANPATSEAASPASASGAPAAARSSSGVSASGVDASAVSSGVGRICSLPAADVTAWPQQTRAVFVLDTSGSMVGLGDGRADIFGGVKAAIVRYVNERQPQSLELFTFNRGLQSRSSYTFPQDRATFDTDMAALEANGNNTYLYRSLKEALPTVASDPNQLTNVFILTDGVDNDPSGEVSAAQALSAFRARGPLDSLHYLALGTEIPKDALAALRESGYAEAQAYPVGQLPELGAMGSRIVDVRSRESVSLDLPDDTPVTLAMSPLPRFSRVSLAAPQVEGGALPLKVSGQIPAGTVGLLCAEVGPPPVTAVAGAESKAAQPASIRQPQRLLLRFASQESAGLTWLNPGADRTLRPGESVTLRYGLSPEVLQKDLPNSGFNTSAAAGLTAELLHGRGSRHAAIRITNTGLAEGKTVALDWLFPDGTSLPLTSITGAAGSLEGQVTPAADTRPGVIRPVPGGTGGASGAGVSEAATQPTPEEASQGFRWTSLLGALLGLALLGGVVALAWREYQRRQALERAAQAAPLLAERARPGSEQARTKHVTVSQAEPVSVGAAHTAAFEQEMPTIEGLEYSEDRFLCLFGTDGRMRMVDAPASGAFDVGQTAGVPHLSGLRMERHRAGLQLLRVPADLEVSQGTRLLAPGDVVRPGTLLGLQMAESSRARTPPLGELSGLGLPLTLTSDGATLKVLGRYAEHHLGLPEGITDLGEACKAPSLRGLRVTLLGGRVLIADIPARLRLTRPHQRGNLAVNPPLRPGTYLPHGTEVHFKGYEDRE